MRRMRLAPPADISGEQHGGGDAGTDLAVAKSDNRTAAGVTFAEVASLELAGAVSEQILGLPGCVSLGA